jgi:sulfide:quinone oxidoreductase
MTDSKFRQVANDFYVAPQLQAEDFAAARATGIRTVINNRPDGEAPDQLSDAQARALAAANGLEYEFVPVVTGRMGPDDVADFATALAAHEGPYLAYCRSGTRSCHLWALATAGERPVEETMQAAAAAGYDLGPTRPVIERLAGGG